MASAANPLGWLRGIAGAVVGGALGYAAFFFLAGQGFYAMILPGALLGIGCGISSQIKSIGLAVVCAAAALLLAVYTEWRFAPFQDDDSFSFFIANVFQLPSVKLIMMTAGALFACWFGMGRDRQPRTKQSAGE